MRVSGFSTPGLFQGPLDKVLQRTYPGDKPKTLINWRGQLWAFIHRMQPGDLVVVPLKTRRSIFIGTITGPCHYCADKPVERRRHTRPNTWHGEWPRTAFDQDLLYSFGALMRVCRIERNEAEKRIRHLIDAAPANDAPKPALTPYSLSLEGISSGDGEDFHDPSEWG